MHKAKPFLPLSATPFVAFSIALSILLGLSFVPANGQESATSREVIYGHKDGLAMTFDVFEAEKPNGAAVVFIVSGGWRSRWVPPEQAKQVLNPFLSAGYTGFAVRHGSSPRYSIAEAVSDVRKAIQFIRSHAEDYGIEADRIGVTGMSAGGHLTLMLATTAEEEESRIAAGVALVPPSDITNYIWSTPDLDPQYRNFPGLDISLEEAKAVSPLYFVTKDDAPCLIISGGKDTLVPPEQGEWMHEKMDEVGVENKFILYENSGHGLENDMFSAVSEAVRWFDKHLN